ncbi:hypothetical protein [Kineobactrum salinum]|uniref:Uncharacterized protein n=1 Tax=Kineobactrum salinum TaxID=2708301 RepID=A0A6C0U5E1_9GAMM|nr:hypothetical protein [Kineobactrum salinum]QIB67148.1 hypothetical protein G3T16_18825 [Kineobactrum salinum]
MNENAKMWAKELPNFKQGRNTLGSEKDGLCCLGVACVLYERETGNRLPRRPGESGKFGDDKLAGPFRVVQAWLGLKGASGRYYFGAENGRDRTSLALRNDSGMTFTEIQKIILSEPEGLFMEDAA